MPACPTGWRRWSGRLNDVISETADLLDAVSNMTDGSSGLGSLTQTAGSISENFGDILDILEDYETLPDDAAADGQKLTELADQTLERVNDLLADIPALSATLDQMTKDATSALDKGETLMVSLTDTLSAASELLQTATGRSARGARPVGCRHAENAGRAA